jgi:hypothetical protein
MPVQIDNEQWATPAEALKALVKRVSRGDDNVDPIALSAAVGAVSAQQPLTKAGKRAVKTLVKLVDAFQAGDTTSAERSATALGLDAVLIHTKAAGMTNAQNGPVFAQAYEQNKRAPIDEPVGDSAPDASYVFDDDSEGADENNPWDD